VVTARTETFARRRTEAETAQWIAEVRAETELPAPHMKMKNGENNSRALAAQRNTRALGALLVRHGPRICLRRPKTGGQIEIPAHDANPPRKIKSGSRKMKTWDSVLTLLREDKNNRTAKSIGAREIKDSGARAHVLRPA
jgi:hypothetical protein